MNANSSRKPREPRRDGAAGRQQSQTRAGGGVAKATFDDQREALELEGQCTELRAERDELKQQLAAANARIRALEDTQKDVINRIDWVLDSIHNLVDS